MASPQGMMSPSAAMGWKVPLAGASISLVSFSVVITLFIFPSPLGINLVIRALGVNFLLFFVVSFVTKPRMDVVKDFFPLPSRNKNTQKA